MLANPQEMVDRGYVTGIRDAAKQIQPNAIDFTVDHIFEITDTPCVIGESRKNMRVQKDAYLIDGYWHLEPNRSYDVSSDMYVEVPEGYAAILILRSTFVRNGMWLASGLYDSGFKGNIGAVLHTGSATPVVEVGVRIGQIMFIESKSVGLYAGGYNAEKGVHWTENTGVKNG